MENASKALIIAGSVLISLVLLAFFVFMFRSGSIIPRAQDLRDEAQAIETFNAQFASFDTKEDEVFDSGSFNNKTKRYIAARELNNISDVISVANLAGSTNYINNHAYDFNERLEVGNSVEVIIDLRGKKDLIKSQTGSTYRYYLIEPNKGVETNFVYGTTSEPGEKEANVEMFNSILSNKVSTYKFLEKLRESKVVIHNNVNYTLFRYYFTGSCNVNEKTR